MGWGVAVEQGDPCHSASVDVAAHGCSSGEGDAVGESFLDHGSGGCDLVQCSIDWLKGHPWGEGLRSHAVGTKRRLQPRLQG